jgi:signal transduction histidine kinase/CheY-like chemotaxis protein
MYSKRVARLFRKHFDIEDAEGALADLQKNGPGSPQAKAILDGLPAFLKEIDGIFAQGDERLHIAVRNLEISSAELNQANRNLERMRHAQKMEALGKLTGGIAHDFNNLLQIIMGQTESMIRAAKNGFLRKTLFPSQEKHLETILRTAERGAELIEHMLIFAREQPAEPHVVNVNATLKDIESMMRRGLGGQVQLAVNVAPGVPNVYVDKLQLETSVLNIAFNARDAMPEGGLVTVDIMQTKLSGQEKLPQGQQPSAGDYVEIRITDTGTGIPPAVMEKIFDPFFTTKEPGKGTGLGLSLVLGFVNSAGGFINVTSKEGQGAVFNILLPVCTAEQEASATPKVVLKHEKPKEAHLLVIEDNANVRELVSQQLREAGYVITAAENADKALTLLKEGGSYDLVFSDLFMPGKLKGLDIGREFRKVRPELKFLMASGYAETALRKEEGTSLAAVRILKKPYRREVLLDAISNELHGQRGAA